MLLDARLNVIGIQAGVPSEEDLKNGAAPEIEILLSLGLPLPIAHPGQPPLIMPFGILRFSITGESAVEFGKTLQEHGAKLPKPSGLLKATNLSEVQAVADQLNQMKGK